MTAVQENRRKDVPSVSVVTGRLSIICVGSSIFLRQKLFSLGTGEHDCDFGHNAVLL